MHDEKLESKKIINYVELPSLHSSVKSHFKTKEKDLCHPDHLKPKNHMARYLGECHVREMTSEQNQPISYSA